MAKNKPVLDKFDLRSVGQIFTGAAPLGGETADELQKQHPSWKVRQGYGMGLISGYCSFANQYRPY